MNCKLSEVSVVGDRVKSEIKIANSLGMTSTWSKRGEFASELPETSGEEPDFIIFSLSEIEKILSNLN